MKVENGFGEADVRGNEAGEGGEGADSRSVERQSEKHRRFKGYI